MSEEFEPLLNDVDLEPGLRGGLGALKAQSVDYDVAAGAARFEASLGPATATGTAAAATSKTMLWVVVGVAVAVTAAAAVAAWALSGDSSESQKPATYASVPEVSRAPARGEDAPQTAAREPAPEQLNEAVTALDSTPDAEPPRSATEVRKREAPSEKKARIPTKSRNKVLAEPRDPDPLRAEMRATHAAKTKLAADPGEALKLARAASEAYPKGVFGPEREGIIVLALFATGADEEAERRANSYLRRYPRGAHAARIRAAVQK